MKPTLDPTPWEVTRAVEVLTRAGARIGLPGDSYWRYLSREQVGEALGMSEGWVRKHEDEFPNRIKVIGGEVRIPIGDLEAALDRWRVQQAFGFGMRGNNQRPGALASVVCTDVPRADGRE